MARSRLRSGRLGSHHDGAKTPTSKAALASTLASLTGFDRVPLSTYYSLMCVFSITPSPPQIYQQQQPTYSDSRKQNILNEIIASEQLYIQGLHLIVDVRLYHSIGAACLTWCRGQLYLRPLRVTELVSEDGQSWMGCCPLLAMPQSTAF